MWVTIAEAALLVHRNPSTVYRWIESGKLETVRRGSGALLVFGAEVLALEAKVRPGRPTGTARPRHAVNPS